MKTIFLLVVLFGNSLVVEAKEQKPIPEVRTAVCSYGKVSVDLRWSDGCYEVEVYKDNGEVVHLPDGDVPAAPDILLGTKPVSYIKDDASILFYSKNKDLVFSVLRSEDGYVGKFSYLNPVKEDKNINYRRLKCVVWGF